MCSKLPVYKGYTIDLKAKQFRKMKQGNIEFIQFKSPKGEKLLGEYIGQLNAESKEFSEIVANLDF